MNKKGICFKMKRTLCAFLTIFMTMSLVSANVFASGVDYDTILTAHGVPQDVISQMTEHQKQDICENISTDAEFAGHETKQLSFADEDGDDSGISPAYVELPERNMDLSVTGFKESNGTYSIYVHFYWYPLVRVANDSLACSMYPGWEVYPGNQKLRVWSNDDNNNHLESFDIAPINPSYSGYDFKIPSNKGKTLGFYEGTAYFYVQKKESSATPRIAVQYAHDDTSACNLSFGVNIGIGSISVTGASDNLQVRGEIFDLPSSFN